MQEKEEIPATAPLSRKAVWLKLLATTEGRIFATGITLSFLGLLVMAVVAIWSPATSSVIGAMAISNVTVGRTVSMSIGYAAGYGHLLVLTVNMITETLLVLLFYPVFVFSLKKLIVFPRLKRILDITQQAAIQNEAKVRKYGVIGLFTFVWFPFWMTGPVVGSAIGYLLQLPAWLTLTVVLSGTFIAILGWGWLMAGIQERAAAIAPWAPALIVVILLAVVIGGYLLNRGRLNKRNNSRH